MTHSIVQSYLSTALIDACIVAMALRSASKTPPLTRIVLTCHCTPDPPRWRRGQGTVKTKGGGLASNRPAEFRPRADTQHSPITAFLGPSQGGNARGARRENGSSGHPSKVYLSISLSTLKENQWFWPPSVSPGRPLGALLGRLGGLLICLEAVLGAS